MDDEEVKLIYEAVKTYIKQNNDDELMFFQTAYFWRFKKHGECVADVCLYRLHAIVPKYVQEFVRYH